MKFFVASLFLFTSYLFAQPTGLDFVDPKTAQKLEDANHGKLYVFFCGHCPGARKRMVSEVTKLADEIQKHKAPIDLVCVTPDFNASGVKDYAKSIGLSNAILASDPQNPLKIGLRNIWQVHLYKGGSSSRTSIQSVRNSVKDPSQHSKIGSFRFSPEGIEDEKLKKIWWSIENGNKKTLSSLISAKKRAKPGKGNGDQVIALYDTVSNSLLEAITSAMEKEDSMETCEELESALAAAKGFHKNKEASDRLKAMKRDKNIKLEYKVKSYYLKYAKLLSGSKKEIAAGKKAMAKLAKKYPETTFGQKAGKH